MLVFDSVSPQNTEPTLQIAFAKAMELSTDVIVATTTGTSAFAALDKAIELDFAGKIVAVSHAWGKFNPGENSLSDASRITLEAAGAIVVTAGHALSGAERSISGKFSGAYPVEIIAHALRMLSAGVKVCVEIGAMTLDAGRATYGRPVVAIAGTGRGLDTACVLTPSYSAQLLDTRVHEILCKPY
ncbi:MAG: hypothetical protein FWG47_03485 [Propionibacteriaceae bacterium]|nr:hypothetical protein [Propionibacteriaceae bacterium]